MAAAELRQSGDGVRGEPGVALQFGLRLGLTPFTLEDVHPRVNRAEEWLDAEAIAKPKLGYGSITGTR
jgi:hypothetical protein